MKTVSQHGPPMVSQHAPSIEHGHSDVARRLDDIGWGLFLLMTGALWLMPTGSVPDGTWLIGTGVLLLGLALVRYARGLGFGALTTVLGVLALAGGVAEMRGAQLPLFAIAFVVLGAAFLLRPMLNRAH